MTLALYFFLKYGTKLSRVILISLFFIGINFSTVSTTLLILFWCEKLGAMLYGKVRSVFVSHLSNLIYDDVFYCSLTLASHLGETNMIIDLCHTNAMLFKVEVGVWEREEPDWFLVIWYMFLDSLLVYLILFKLLYFCFYWYIYLSVFVVYGL